MIVCCVSCENPTAERGDGEEREKGGQWKEKKRGGGGARETESARERLREFSSVFHSKKHDSARGRVLSVSVTSC